MAGRGGHPNPASLTSKICTRCKEQKDVAEFRRIVEKRAHCGFSYYAKCRRCERATKKRQSPDAKREWRRRRAAAMGLAFYPKGPMVDQAARASARRDRAVLAAAARSFISWFARLNRGEVDRERSRAAYRARYASMRDKEIARSRERKRLYRESASECGYKWSDLYEIRDAAVDCAYCGRPLDERRHLDHVVPLSMGGKTEPANLVASCASCNLEKAGRDPMKWAAMRGSRMVERMSLILMGA